MSTIPATARRPFGVSLLSVLIILGGAFDILGGIIFMVERNDNELIADLDLESSSITAFGVGFVIIGLVALLVGFGLWKGADWARYLVAIIAIVRLASLVYTMIQFDVVHWYSAIVPTVIYLVVAWYLLGSPKSKAFFEPGATL